MDSMISLETDLFDDLEVYVYQKDFLRVARRKCGGWVNVQKFLGALDKRVHQTFLNELNNDSKAVHIITKRVKFTGYWVPLKRARELAKSYGLSSKVGPLLNFDRVAFVEYNGVSCWEMFVTVRRDIQVRILRRQDNNMVNMTQIFDFYYLSWATRTEATAGSMAIQREFQKSYPQQYIVQNDPTLLGGIWAPLDVAREFSEKNGLSMKLMPILGFDVGKLPADVKKNIPLSKDEKFIAEKWQWVIEDDFHGYPKAFKVLGLSGQPRLLDLVKAVKINIPGNRRKRTKASVIVSRRYSDDYVNATQMIKAACSLRISQLNDRSDNDPDFELSNELFFLQRLNRCKFIETVFHKRSSLNGKWVPLQFAKEIFAEIHLKHSLAKRFDPILFDPSIEELDDNQDEIEIIPELPCVSTRHNEVIDLVEDGGQTTEQVAKIEEEEFENASMKQILPRVDENDTTKILEENSDCSISKETSQIPEDEPSISETYQIPEEELVASVSKETSQASEEYSVTSKETSQVPEDEPSASISKETQIPEEELVASVSKETSQASEEYSVTSKETSQVPEDEPSVPVSEETSQILEDEPVASVSKETSQVSEEYSVTSKETSQIPEDESSASVSKEISQIPEEKTVVSKEASQALEEDSAAPVPEETSLGILIHDETHGELIPTEKRGQRAYTRIAITNKRIKIDYLLNRENGSGIILENEDVFSESNPEDEQLEDAEWAAETAEVAETAGLEAEAQGAEISELEDEDDAAEVAEAMELIDSEIETYNQQLLRAPENISKVIQSVGTELNIILHRSVFSAYETNKMDGLLRDLEGIGNLTVKMISNTTILGSLNKIKSIYQFKQFDSRVEALKRNLIRGKPSSEKKDTQIVFRRNDDGSELGKSESYSDNSIRNRSDSLENETNKSSQHSYIRSDAQNENKRALLSETTGGQISDYSTRYRSESPEEDTNVSYHQSRQAETRRTDSEICLPIAPKSMVRAIDRKVSNNFVPQDRQEYTPSNQQQGQRAQYDSTSVLPVRERADTYVNSRAITKKEASNPFSSNIIRSRKRLREFEAEEQNQLQNLENETEMNVNDDDYEIEMKLQTIYRNFDDYNIGLRHNLAKISRVLFASDPQ